MGLVPRAVIRRCPIEYINIRFQSPSHHKPELRSSLYWLRSGTYTTQKLPLSTPLRTSPPPPPPLPPTLTLPPLPSLAFPPQSKARLLLPPQTSRKLSHK
ncbi:hypothetical protein BaRGS_00013194 [Batillaria attramentaria]|uniref:Uncharacterized protein n=1 Tax=Batillaria attramentaria TaxID=370345 RepID=A0ABD0L888_9CAEN